jgi:hypothetical protein
MTTLPDTTGFEKTMTHRAIAAALGSGRYRVDADAGRIFGPVRELQIKRHPNQHCPTARLHVAGLPKHAYSVPAHKVIAYAIWGDAAFEPGIHVRHLNGDNEDSSRANLALGTPRENEMDKPPEVRSRSARLARAAQGHTPKNAVIDAGAVDGIRAELDANRVPSGRVRRGVVKSLAERHGVSPSAISCIGSRKTWTGPRPEQFPQTAALFEEGR